MPTNDERREVAARLRELPDIPSEMGTWEGGLMFIEPSRDDEADYSQIHKVLLGCFPAELMHPCDYEELHMRLADLIEPEPDLTCELEPTASERTNAPVRVYECDCCGRSCDSVYAEDYVYCPYCGRLNTAREVEVEE